MLWVRKVLCSIRIHRINAAIHVQVCEIEQFGEDRYNIAQTKFNRLQFEVLVLGFFVLFQCLDQFGNDQVVNRVRWHEQNVLLVLHGEIVCLLLWCLELTFLCWYDFFFCFDQSQLR
jgi:hypothetical protein